MSALPILPEPDARRLPDYLPARMVNEFIYCPRLFFYEWVEGVFRENADTVEGKAQHRRVDAKAAKLHAVGGPQIQSKVRFDGMTVLVVHRGHDTVGALQ